MSGRLLGFIDGCISSSAQTRMNLSFLLLLHWGLGFAVWLYYKCYSVKFGLLVDTHIHICIYVVYLEGKGWVMKMNTLVDLDQYFKDLGRQIPGSKNHRRIY